MRPTTYLRIGVYYLYVGLLMACGLAAFVAAAINIVAGHWLNLEVLVYLAAVLPMAGAGMCRGVAAARRREARERQLRRTHPAEPWRWRADWADGCVVFSERDATREKWGVLGTVALATAPVVMLARTSPELLEPGPRIFLIALLAGLNLWLLQFVWRSWRRAARAGTAVLRLAGVPVTPGFTLQATVVPHVPIAEPEAVTLSLRCIARYTSSKGRSSDTVRWSKDITLPAWSGTDLTVRIDVPSEQPPTAVTNSSNAILWELHVSSGSSHAPLRWVFTLPVFSQRPGALPAPT